MTITLDVADALKFGLALALGLGAGSFLLGFIGAALRDLVGGR